MKQVDGTSYAGLQTKNFTSGLCVTSPLPSAQIFRLPNKTKNCRIWYEDLNTLLSTDSTDSKCLIMVTTNKGGKQ